MKLHECSKILLHSP